MLIVKGGLLVRAVRDPGVFARDYGTDARSIDGCLTQYGPDRIDIPDSVRHLDVETVTTSNRFGAGDCASLIVNH